MCSHHSSSDDIPEAIPGKISFAGIRWHVITRRVMTTLVDENSVSTGIVDKLTGLQAGFLKVVGDVATIVCEL